MLIQTPDLRDYQITDINELVARFERGDPAAICEWGPGLGKSLAAMLIAGRLQHRRVLILAPAIGLVSWAEQFAQWAPAVPLLLIRSGKDISKLREKHAAVVVTFDLVRQPEVLTTLREWVSGGFGVIDEAQYLRGPDSQRTAYAYGLQQGLLAKAKHVLLLSGTLEVSWPTDLWTHLARWMPDRITHDGVRLTYEQFRERYLVTQEVPIPGAYRKTRTQIRGLRPEMAGELAAITRGMSVRRTKAEANLPPLTWVPVPVELSAADRKRIDTELMDHLPERLQRLAQASVGGDDAAQTRFMDALADYAELVAVTLRVLGAGKAKAVCREIDERLANAPMTKAVGVFAVNHSVLDVVQADLTKHGVLRIDGSTSANRRAQIVETFQAARGPRVFAGQISACGTALTLTRADECWFVQQSWTPGENLQAASRFHRIGQNNPVVAYIPYVPGTIDTVVSRVLQKKQHAASVRHGDQT